MEVAKGSDFKRYSKGTLGTMMSDFMAYEWAKATVAIIEHAVSIDKGQWYTSQWHELGGLWIKKR